MHSESPIVAVGCSCTFRLVQSRRRVRRYACHVNTAPARSRDHCSYKYLKGLLLLATALTDVT